jgi:aminoglycoside 2'-N-acetyltransferase I
VRAVMDAAFGTDPEEAFGDDDWEHALGGLHVLLERGDEVLSHAAVVERTLEIEGRPLLTGYLEAVATAPAEQGRGHGSVVLRAVTEHIRATFQLGALGTGSHGFYQRLGWETWRGQAFVREPGGLRRTPDDEGYILVLRTSTSPGFEGTERLTCDWRAGDVW